MSASYTPFECLCPKKINAYAMKKHRNPYWNFTKHLHPRNLTEYLHRNPPEPHQLSAPEPSGTSPGICIATLQNLKRYLHRNPPEPHQVPAPEFSGTLPNTCQNSPGICTRTPRNFNTVSAPERSGTSTICSRTLRNFTSYRHRNPPEPHRLSASKPSGTSPGTCT